MERSTPEKIDCLTVYDKSPSFMKGFFLKKQANEKVEIRQRW